MFVTAEPPVSSGLSAPPIIGRLAGLPARVLEPLGSSSCIALLHAREPVERELEEARKAIVEAIGDALPRFDARARRLLLTVRRSCFNGREIGKHKGKAGWADLLRVSASLVERIVVLEEQLHESDRALDALYERELTRERRHILELTEDCRFLRGVAVGRPGLVRKIRSQAPSLVASDFTKRPAKWEESLLRFVTRAAAKLSANSTLTSYALGSIQDSPSGNDLRFDDGPRREISLVRLNRPQLEQLQTLLMRHPLVRERALVAWNDSVEELELGRYRYLRDGHWQLEAGAESFEFVKPARIKVTLPNPVLDSAREALREGPLRYQALLALLEERLAPAEGAPADARGALDQLLDLGLLLLLPPWPTHEPLLEQRIGRFLRSLPDDPVLRESAEILDELLALEEGFASAPLPERSVFDMGSSVSRLMQTVASAAGHEGPLTPRVSFFEDVLYEPAGDSGDDRGVFQIASSAVDEILESASLISRFDELFNLRHDVLHTLARWWRDHEPGRREAPFLEVARGFAPVWKGFIGFYKTSGESPLHTFDPLSSPAMTTLRDRREWLLSRTREQVSRSPAKDSLPLPVLAELVESLPRRYAPLLGASVFLQPTDAEGTSWVLNNVTQGTGRYLSRVVPALDGPRRERFLEHLTARSVVALEGEEADLLEVKHPWIHLVRAHPPQAARVLELRGLHLDLPGERRLGLGDLTVQADLDSETFRLLDPSGRRLLPASLSTISDSGLPNLLRFLLMFGPGETRGVFPFSYSESDGPVRAHNRLTCGKVVLRRRSWAIQVGSLFDGGGDPGDLQSYVEVDRWRRRLGLPEEGYYYEQAHCGKTKPQYVRFDSPSLCRLFVSSLRKMSSGELYIEEALPSPASFPFDASVDRRGLELLIDTLAIRDPGGNPSADVAGRKTERTSLRKELQYV